MLEYELDEQVGHLLRRANQRHKAIFVAEMQIKLPPTQFAALARLRSSGDLSQNQLGRLTAMDSATITGVVSRLVDRGWVSTVPSRTDGRRVSVSLTPAGAELIESLIPNALEITKSTLSVLDESDCREALRLLKLLAADGDESA